MKKIFVILLGSTLILSSCTKDKGSVSMTYNKGVAVYADIEELRSTELLTNSKPIVNPGKIFIGETALLIGEKGVGIHVFDNTNPNSPVNKAFIQLPYTNEFYVADNILYAESHYDLVKINLVDLGSPQLLDRLEYAFSDALTNDKGEVLIGFDYNVVTEKIKLNSPEAIALQESHSLYFDYNSKIIPESVVPSSFTGTSESGRGTLNKIAVYNDYIYVVGDKHLHTFNNNGIMSKSDNESLGRNLETIYPEGDRLYIGTRSSMITMDISNPADPNETSSYEHPTSCDPVLPFGNVAYLTLRTADFSGCSGDENTLDVVDITNPSNPEQLNSIVMQSPYGMSVINNHLFVGEGVNGLEVFDITNPELPVSIDHYDDIEAYDIMMHPSISNRLLITNENGLEQYQLDYNTMEISLLSHIGY